MWGDACGLALQEMGVQRGQCEHGGACARGCRSTPPPGPSRLAACTAMHWLQSQMQSRKHTHAHLSAAVNASLLALSRLRIFCTEPFRIPLAGKVTTCCFDKTGTLTSDHFVLEGVAGCGAAEGGAEPEFGTLQDSKSLPRDTARVLAACQSLVQVCSCVGGVCVVVLEKGVG